MTTDAELLHRSIKGEECAFTAIYDRNAKAVYRYAYSLTSDTDLAEEITQDTFLTAWRRREEVDLAGTSMLGWLLVTCRHFASNARRRRATRISVPLDHQDAHTWDLRIAAEGPDTSDQDRAEELAWALEAISTLNPIDRRLVELCLIHERPYAEAANELGLTLVGATKRISRSRGRLRILRKTYRQTSEGDAQRA